MYEFETTGRQGQLASNIMGWLAAKCGSTGRRFNSINGCTTTANIVVIYN